MADTISTPTPPDESETQMPPIDQSWITDRILEIVGGIGRIEEHLVSLDKRQEGQETRLSAQDAKLLALPCTTENTRIVKLEQAQIETDRNAYWQSKTWLVVLGALLSACGGLTVVGVQKLVETKVPAITQVYQPDVRIGG